MPKTNMQIVAEVLEIREMLKGNLRHLDDVEDEAALATYTVAAVKLRVADVLSGEMTTDRTAWQEGQR